MTWLAFGAAIFCALMVWALACELAAEWIIDKVVGK